MLRFGLFLLHEGYVNADQLVAALEAQQQALPPLGQIALEQGKLSVHEVFSIVRVQGDFPCERFGDLAIEMGLLNRKELSELLLEQSERKPPLQAVLVKQQCLTPQQAESALRDFRRSFEQGGNPANRRKSVASRDLVAPSPQPAWI